MKKANKNIIGIILIALVIIIFMCVFIALFFNSIKAVQLDKKTFCPLNGIPSVTVIMIDQTDSLSPIQQASLRNELQKIQDDIPLHGKLEIYAVGNTKVKILKPLLSMCNPGRGDDISPLTGNPKHVERIWKKAFDTPINTILTALMTTSESKESPIMESIQSIAVTAFNNPDSQNAERHFVIASDMLHFTSEFNLYDPSPDVETLKSKDYFQKMHSDLRNVTIEILLFRRTTAANIQGHNLIKFWDAFLKNQGATIERIYSISG